MQLNSYGLGTATGNIPDVDGKLTILAPEECPFTSLVNKPSDISNTFHEKFADDLRKPRTTGTAEGYAGQHGSNQATKRARFGAYVQRWMEEYAVTDVQQLISEKGGNYVTSNELALARSKCMRQLKRDIEATCLSANECQAGSDGEMKMRGAFTWLAQTQTPQIGADFLAPAAQRLTGVTDLVEYGDNSLNSVLKSLFENGGGGDYHIFAGSDYVEDVDLFTRRANAGGEDTRYRIIENGKPVEVTMMCSVFRTSFGRVTVHPDLFIRIDANGVGSTKSALVAAMPFWELAWLEPLADKAEARWRNAGGEGGAVKGIGGLYCSMPKSSGTIINS